MDPNQQAQTVSTTFININEAPHFNQNRIYPAISIQRNLNPKRLWAFPVLGGFIKLIILIPQSFMTIFAYILIIIMGFINVFVVLITGKLWIPYYNWVVRAVNLYAKCYCFLHGVTDRYPGFNYKTFEGLTVNLPYPQSSNRLYAFPLLGFCIRFVLLMPFLYLSNYFVIGTSSLVLYGSSAVFLKKYYPESAHEMVVDSLRLILAQIAFFTGVSDTYPSFRVSENHLVTKIFFIMLPFILILVINFATFLSFIVAMTTNPPKMDNFNNQQMYPGVTPFYESQTQQPEMEYNYQPEKFDEIYGQ